ncbi:site-specific integrase [Marinifilum flexuosum]|uniref:Integrase-like protein n=1 Tax=Marinifilum flexuosum TaxID=1117708 RepID=A0A419X9M3_9BACT|nr:site-specific integrase [Marinifilum flexuosum]RKE04464.1 integrase-like protein [Marinifilum flexuosum]
MASTKLILDTRKAKKDGTFPIKLAVSQKTKTAYISAKISIPKEYWDNGRIKRGCPNIDNLRQTNNELASLLFDADDYIYELEKKNKLDRLNAKQIADYIKNGGKSNNSNISFNEYLKKYLDEIKSPSTREKYDFTLRAVENFTNGEIIFFDEINKAWLNRFKEWRLQKSAPTTTNIDLRNIRAVYNRAIDVDEIIGQEYYPFRKFEFAKDKPRNLRLPIDTIRAIRDFKTQTEYVALARDFFMLSFYLIGMNNSDIFEIKEIFEGRIEYERNKTQKSYSVKIEPEIQELLDKLKGKEKLLIYQERYKNIKTLNNQINKGLKKIGEDETVNVPGLIMYHARHSWAGIAAKKPIGASKALIAQALGHGKTTVTDTYFDYDNELVDDLNRKVIDSLKNNKTP